MANGDVSTTTYDDSAVAGAWAVALVEMDPGERQTKALRVVPAGSASGAVLVASAAKLATVVPTLDTSAYASGDVLFVAKELPDALIAPGSAAMLTGVTLIDKDDQVAAGLDLYFFSKSVSMGSLNAPATSISDSDAAYFLGKVSVASGDWEDVGGVKWATAAAPGKGLLLACDDLTLTTSVWVIGVTRGTPTYTASGITLRVSIVR